MKERPILFSGPMVKAILEGRKTQTRRLITPQPSKAFDYCRVNRVGPWFHIEADHPQTVMHTVSCPHGVEGDRLWGRETWATVRSLSKVKPSSLQPGFPCEFKAGGSSLYDGEPLIDREARWRPSIFMPRWASRINLELTEIRVERLNEISEDDAKSEGVQFYAGYWSGCPHPIKGSPKCFNTPVQAFQSIWDFINGKRAPWASNPWVFAETFRRVE